MDAINNVIGSITAVPGAIAENLGWLSPPVLVIMFINMILLIVVIVRVIQYFREGFAQPGEKVIMYYVPWCGFCKSDIPAFDSLAVKYGDKLTFERVNCQENPTTGISAYPTYICVKSDGSKTSHPGAFGDVASMDAYIRQVFEIDAWERDQAIKAAQAQANAGKK